MLQPRLLTRTSPLSNKCILPSLRRTYANLQTTPWAIEKPPLPAHITSDPQFDSRIPKPKPNYKPSDIIRTYKPRTPGLRHLKRPINDHLWTKGPFRRLTFPKIGQGKGGRNNSGRITCRHHGGGARRRIRTVDFSRKDAGEHVVMRIEYDPNRSAHLALIRPVQLNYKSLPSKKGTRKTKVVDMDQYSYILAAEGMRAGDIVQSYMKGIPEKLLEEMGGTVDPGMLAARTSFRGNCLPLHLVPLGTQVFNVGSRPHGPGVFCRSAGTYAVVVSKEETDEQGRESRHVVVKLQSGEVRKVPRNVCATIGVASNPHWQFRQLGKAGRSRLLNIRPTVRGLAMNACDHPHGGGRGKSKGNRHPVSPWGKPAKSGYKTRRKRNINIWVVHERPRNQGRRRSKGKAKV